MLTALKKGDGGDDAKKPGGALLGLGGLGGLTGVGNLKSKLSTKLVTNKVDEAVWRSNLTDMHRVRNMARTLWLSLEHTNEAVMRVALEIVTCRKARKILWWNDDFWASEEGKPEHLRGVIEEKFDTILQYLGKELKERPVVDPKGGPSNREVELEKQNGELQKKLRMAELQLAEARRQLEQQLQEARDRIAQLESSGASRGEAAMQAELQRLRALEQEQADALRRSMIELQEYQKKNSQLEAVLQERLAELERARREAEEAQEAARQQAADLDRLRLASAGSAGAAGALLQKELEDLRQKNGKLLAEVAQLKGQLASTQAALRTAGRSKEPSGVLEEEPKVSPEDLAELERLRGLEAEWKLRSSKGATCWQCGKACMHCTGTLPIAAATVQQDCSSPKKSARSNHELQELVERKDAEISRLKADKKNLETERVDLLAMIDKLRSQIERLKEAAREAGHGDLVDKLMEEAEIAATMRSPEMSCFTRLYQDAVRRMIKAGSSPKKEPVRDFYRTRQGAVQMTQQFPGVLEDSSPGDQQLRSPEYPHAGRHAKGHATLPVSLQSLEFGAGVTGRGGGFDHHARFDQEASPTTSSTTGGLPRHGSGNRMIATAGSLQRSSPGFGLDWDMGPGAAPRGSGIALEGGTSNWRTTSPKSAGFGGPASLRKAQAAQGLPRVDSPHGLLAPSGDSLKFSRSEPQLRLKAAPSSLPQLAAGNAVSRKPSEDILAAGSLQVGRKSSPLGGLRVQSRRSGPRALRAPSPAARRSQDPEPLLMISA